MTTATRQQNRRAQFAARIIAAGWYSESEYMTAVINCRAHIAPPSKRQLAHRAERARKEEEGK